jgi:serine/threonine protein kinase
MTGGSIKILTLNYGPLDEPNLRKYAGQILMGLRYLHSQNIPHRALRPSNIFIDHSGNLRLTDFAVFPKLREWVELPVNALAKSEQWVGNPKNRAEIEKSKKEDIYALGLTLIELVGGNRNKPKSIPEGLTRIAKDFLAHCLRR